MKKVFVSDYGMLLVLFALCAYYSWVTYDLQHPTGAGAGAQLAEALADRLERGARVLVMARPTAEDEAFAGVLKQALESRGIFAHVEIGGPAEARERLESWAASGERLDAIAATESTAAWSVFDRLEEEYPGLGAPELMRPSSYYWPNFLKTENLLNIANQIAVIAIIAIGMTMVIITAGIDLSVGSLIALSAVVSTLAIRDWAGGEAAGSAGMILGALAGIGVCAGLGAVSGALVTAFRIPAFIATLGMMLVASGLAFIFAEGESIYQVPESFVWLGRGSAFGVPNAVWLMFGLYGAAHVLMTRMALGRYIYAAGGNAEAARLSGVPVNWVRLFVYTASGALAGLGGIIMASQLKSGSPTYGGMYELYVIAAVVVGGTSLAGGEGKVLGTLIGALIIAVIQNGMNLTGVESYTQKVVLGAVILGAVLMDMLKNRGWPGLRRMKAWIHR